MTVIWLKTGNHDILFKILFIKKIQEKICFENLSSMSWVQFFDEIIVITKKYSVVKK